jgi:hypothetical protein
LLQVWFDLTNQLFEYSTNFFLLSRIGVNYISRLICPNAGGGSRAIPPETSSYINVFKRCFLSRHLGNWLKSSHLIFFDTTFYKHFKGMFLEPLPPFCWLLKHQFHCLAVLDCFSQIRLKPTGNPHKTSGTGLNQMSS